LEIFVCEVSLFDLLPEVVKPVLIEVFKEMLPDLDEEDMKELVSGVIRKLTAITDQQFQGIDFSLALDIEE